MNTPLDVTRTAYLFVTHGSRDPRPDRAVKELARRVRATLSQKFSAPPLVETAALELQPQPLHEQISEFADRAVGQNIRILRVVPLFLLPGVHVMEDIPEEVELAKRTTEKLKINIEISIAPYLGSHPGIVELLTHAMSSANSPDARILLSHGSRRPGGNQPIEAIAEQLHRQSQITQSQITQSQIPVLVAYWSVAPALEQRVRQLVEARCARIEILPYFLFSGGITDAIARDVARLARQFPKTSLQLVEPIGVSDALAGILVDLLDRESARHH
ncbi:MAG: sirohydrochlorin chelatase [Cyanobacteriota bacterium]|nr:sirohydrochlorin chelatase [Cyanobacteriota bacterium]